jgi:hypothetical protein
MKFSTRYQRSIRSVEGNSILKPGSNNKKLGFKIKSKKWKGKRLYSLTLTERETCPRSCHHWDDCYGDNMPFAHRFSIEGLEQKIESEIETLLEKHPQGIVIRLHVLGDFYSTKYVDFWQEMLITHPELCIFGYSAREGKIANKIRLLNFRFSDRCVIRFSRSHEYNGKDMFAAEEGFEGKSFDCPEQTGKLPSCAACGLCWSVPKTVKFQTH